MQDPDAELPFLLRLAARRGRPPRRLREDFCGTALLAARFVARAPRREAVGVDRDPAVLAWARRHRLPALGAAGRRLRLVRADVRAGPRGPFDAVLALNFSWMGLRTRPALLAWARHARGSLAPGGALVLDAFGGWEALQPLTERRRLRGGAVYEWEQLGHDPVSGEVRCAISFRLPGGRRLRRAFRYHWRLWSLPELRDVLAEAGFASVEVRWDVHPSNGATRYARVRRAADQPGWIAYVVARRGARRGDRPPRESAST